MDKKYKMNAKKILVSFLLIASVLFLATAVSATSVTRLTVGVNDIEVVDNDLVTPGIQSNISVIAGETIEVDVWFTADDNESDVELKVTLEGDKDEVESKIFDVEDGMAYHKTLVIKVPSDLDEDKVSDEITMNLELLDVDDDYFLNVQRPSYDFDIKSVITSNVINAGQTMPVEVTLKNVGYNDADDVYITVSIPELNIEQSGYFGDVVTGYTESTSTDDDDSNTMSGKLNLVVPYTAKGLYKLVVEVSNDEKTSTFEKEITISNSEIAVKSGNNLILLNNMNKPIVYTVVYNGNEVVVDVSALQSKTVPIEVPAGDYNFDVVVYSGATVLSTVAFSGTSQNDTVELTNPVFVLTVILSVVFLVLLVVLVVLITKKPQKTEEFGESYY